MASATRFHPTTGNWRSSRVGNELKQRHRTTIALYSASSGAELRAWTTSKFIDGSDAAERSRGFQRTAAGVHRYLRPGLTRQLNQLRIARRDGLRH